MSEEMRILFHAPTPQALKRARTSAVHILKTDPESVVRIVCDGDAVGAALEEPDSATDPLLLLCQAALEAVGLDAGRLTTVPLASLTVAKQQRKGWIYIRA